MAFLFAAFLLGPFLSTANAQEDEKLALAIANTALKAQNDQEFSFAAEEWERLLKKHPKSSLVDRAYFNSGICYIQLQKYDQAIKQFNAAIPLLKDEDVQVPTAKFYLGYAQMELGSQLSDGNESQRQKSTELLTTATETFGNLLKDSPQFSRNDNVCYYQAGAFEKLNKLDEALAAYKSMANFKSTDKTYLFDSMFAICDLHYQLGQYGESLKATNRFIAQGKPIDHPLLDRVNLLKGKVLVELAIDAQKQADVEGASNAEAKRNEAQQNFAEADALFKAIAAQDAASKPQDFQEVLQEAKYQRAFCLGRLEKFEDAAKLYADLVTNGDPELADQALAYAGANYLSAGKTDLAIDALIKSTQSDSKYAADSAHLLAGIYLEKEQFENAYNLATAFLPKAEQAESKVLVDLKLDQADAAYGIADRRAESIELFNAIAQSHPDHPLAAPALYNSAFASLETDDVKTAIATAERFESKYANSDYLGDVLEVKADALLLDGQYELAAAAFDRLTQEKRFENNPKRSLWQLRAGLALFLQKKYQQTLDRLTPVAGKFQLASRNAETYHWIGSSHYQLKAYPAAELAYRNSLNADANWSRSDESMSFLARSLIYQDKETEAKKVTADLASAFPKSKWLSDVYYLMGSRSLDAENYADALVNFEKVINDFPTSTQIPSSLYGAAWSHQKEKRYEKAEGYYQQLVTNHADYQDQSLIENAKIQRASIQRRMGKSGSSIAELEALLKTELDAKQRVNVLLELGLAQVNVKAWDDAVKTFQSLIDAAPDDPRKDDFYYELAWANRENGAEEKAIEYFEKIASETKDSVHAAEANFHLGNVAYDKKDFPEAITRFTNCMQPEADGLIREKASYKLGWSFYKQEKYPEAHGAFKEQVDEFKEGDLLADGLFMVAESLYRQKKYEESFAAYLKAKPAVDASEVVDKKLRWLTMLHGSQSANKTKKYNEAINLAKGIEGVEANDAFKQDVFLELGTAFSGLKDREKAIEYWTMASESLGKTGARAYCMIGDQYFREKKFDDATNQFKRVFFGFGGSEASDDIKPWQAYARYEAARCNFVQVATAKDNELKIKKIEQAKQHFEALLRDYPDDRLATEAKKQLETLTKLQKQITQE